MSKIKLKQIEKCEECKKSDKNEPSLYFSRFLDKWVCWKCLNENVAKIIEN